MALKGSGLARLRVLLIVIVILGGLGIFLWMRVRQSKVQTLAKIGDIARTWETPDSSPPAVASGTTASSTTPTPTEVAVTPASEPGLSSTNTNADDKLSRSYVGTLKLVIPVAGVKPDQLLDTFTDARTEGRSHDAIDIPAVAGTPVLATSDGEIVKLFQSERGGITIYQLSPDKQLVFYYAHLQRYAEGLEPGKYVRQGEVIAYVGDTGNAGAGNYHLHFSIAVLTDPKRYWNGPSINPYPLLRN